MNALLWTLAGVGVWNAINMAARLYYRAPWWPYFYHVALGAWAAYLLWAGY